MKLLLIFDLDGTLVDSKPDLMASVNYVRNHFDLQALQDHEIAAFIGNGPETLIERALGEPAASPRVYEGLQMFLSHYRAHMLDASVLYPGVRETLGALSEASLAVLTNKPVRLSCAMLDGLGVYDFFAAVYGGNSFERKKPDPIGIHQILSETACRPERTCMIGDSAIDVLTGRNAGVQTVGVTYGYAVHTFSEAQPDFRIGRFEELLKIG